MDFAGIISGLFENKCNFCLAKEILERYNELKKEGRKICLFNWAYMYTKYTISCTKRGAFEKQLWEK